MELVRRAGQLLLHQNSQICGTLEFLASARVRGQKCPRHMDYG